MDNAWNAWERPDAVRTWLTVLTLVAALFVRAAPAHAEDRAALEREAASSDVETAASALYALATIDDAAGEYARAVERYRAAVAKLPSFRDAPRAVARAEQLEAHSEGAFVPLARLERVRRDP